MFHRTVFLSMDHKAVACYCLSSYTYHNNNTVLLLNMKSLKKTASDEDKKLSVFLLKLDTIGITSGCRFSTNHGLIFARWWVTVNVIWKTSLYIYITGSAFSDALFWDKYDLSNSGASHHILCLSGRAWSGCHSEETCLKRSARLIGFLWQSNHTETAEVCIQPLTYCLLYMLCIVTILSVQFFVISYRCFMWAV